MKEESHGSMSLDVDSVLSALENALGVAEYFAKITTTLWDDVAVQVIRVIMDDKTLVEWLRRLLNDPAIVGSSGLSRTSFILDHANDSATPAVKEAIERVGLDWTTVLSNLPAIVTLVLTVLGRRR